MTVDVWFNTCWDTNMNRGGRINTLDQLPAVWLRLSYQFPNVFYSYYVCKYSG